MTRLIFQPILPAALLLFGLIQTASAEDAFFTRNATIKSAGFNWVYIGYARNTDIGSNAHPTSPTIRLVKGGHIDNGLFSYNRSRVIVSGGSVNGTLDAAGSSTATVTAGSITNLIGEDSSTINLSGGSLDDSLVSYGHSAVNLSGGTIAGDVIAYEHSTVNVRGGSIRNGLSVQGSSTVNLFGTELSASRSLWGAPSGYSEYTLSGRLADGTNADGMTVDVQESTGARFTLSSPAGVRQRQSSAREGGISLGAVVVGLGLLLALGGLAVAAKRKKSPPSL